MTDKDAKTYLKIIKEDIWEDNGYGIATEEYENQVEALDAAIKAVEVVEKIKKAFITNAVGDTLNFDIASSRCYIDTTYHILCDAYGTEESMNSWIKEYKNDK